MRETKRAQRDNIEDLDILYAEIHIYKAKKLTFESRHCDERAESIQPDVVNLFPAQSLFLVGARRITFGAGVAQFPPLNIGSRKCYIVQELSCLAWTVNIFYNKTCCHEDFDPLKGQWAMQSRTPSPIPTESECGAFIRYVTI